MVITPIMGPWTETAWGLNSETLEEIVALNEWGSCVCGEKTFTLLINDNHISYSFADSV